MSELTYVAELDDVETTEQKVEEPILTITAAFSSENPFSRAYMQLVEPVDPLLTVRWQMSSTVKKM